MKPLDVCMWKYLWDFFLVLHLSHNTNPSLILLSFFLCSISWFILFICWVYLQEQVRGKFMSLQSRRFTLILPWAPLHVLARKATKFVVAAVLAEVTRPIACDTVHFPPVSGYGKSVVPSESRTIYVIAREIPLLHFFLHRFFLCRNHRKASIWST